MSDSHDRVVNAAALAEKTLVLNTVEKSLFSVIFSVLEPFTRPPSDADVDAALGRIGDADALAHDTACSAIRYVRDMLDEVRRQGGSEEDFSHQFKELRALAIKYEEAMMP